MHLPWMKKKEENPVMGLKKHIDDVFENFWKNPFDFSEMSSLMKNDFNPKLEIKETDKEVSLVAELPGMSEKDIDLSVDDNILVIKGEKKEEEEKKEGEYHYTERKYGSFYRSIPLPTSIVTENIEASFDKGVLKVIIPKNKEESTRKKIQVRTS